MSANTVNNINSVMQGVALAILLWVGSSVQDLKTNQAVYDYRLNQLEKDNGTKG